MVVEQAQLHFMTNNPTSKYDQIGHTISNEVSWMETIIMFLCAEELLSEMGTKNSNLLNTEILTADQDKGPHFGQPKNMAGLSQI